MQIIKDYESRLAQPIASLGESVLDLIAKHNKTATQDEQLSHEEIIGNCVVFHVAGVDTSKSCLEFVIQHLARDQQCQKKFRDEVVLDVVKSGADSYNTYANNETLRYFTKETLRIYGPVAVYFPRVATVDFKVGGF